MNKNLIWIIVAIIIIIAVLGIIVYKNSNNQKNENTNIENATDNLIDNTTEVSNNEKKILVVYYSAQNHTKNISEKIAKNLNADIFVIEPENAYTSNDLDWTDSNSRVSKEHNDESLRNVKLKNTVVQDWQKYDTILIGYPIWWGIAAWPVNTFVKENNFDGKTVIPFCTSSSSGLGQSGELLQKEANSGNWKEGHRFSSVASDLDIKTWTDTLK